MAHVYIFLRFGSGLVNTIILSFFYATTNLKAYLRPSTGPKFLKAAFWKPRAGAEE